MIRSILSLIGGIFQGIGGWMAAYSSKENQASRVQKDELEKIDQTQKDLEQKNLERIRRDLAGGR